MKRTALWGLALLLIAGGVLLAISASRIGRRNSGLQAQLVGSASDPAWARQDWLTDYHLTERSGRDFDSHELAGDVHVVSFFFASCPGPCERQNRQLEVIHSAYAAQGVKFLSITCDPKRDTPTALSQYARKFQADPQQWLFLTGDMKLLRRVGAEVYGVALDEQTHVESFLVYDRAGKLRGKFPWNKPDELIKMRSLLDELLAETREQAAARPASDPRSAPALPAAAHGKTQDEAEVEEQSGPSPASGSPAAPEQGAPRPASEAAPTGEAPAATTGKTQEG